MLELNTFSIIVLLGIAQGLFLVFSLRRIKDVNKDANQLLTVFVLLITLTMIGRFLLDIHVDLTFLSFIALPDSIIFLYGPVLYLYLQKLLIKPIKRPKLLAHFIPAILFIISNIPSLLNESNIFHLLWVEFTRVRFIVIEGGAIVHNIIYFYLGASLVLEYQKSSNNEFSFKQFPSYLKAIFALIALTLIVWGISYISWVTANYNILSAIGYRTVWIILPFIMYTLGFFAIRQPELFKINPEYSLEKDAVIDNEDLEILKEKVAKSMQEHRPFLNPRFTLQGLSELTGIKPHLLSKVINKGFELNFSDYINSYRVEEFKELVMKEEKREFTLLAVALEAGFNSKTTFNTTFRKFTNTTPREFVNVIHKK